MDVPELVQGGDGRDHLGHVEPGVFLLEDARVVEERAKVAAGHKVHGEVDKLGVLERVQEAHEPVRVRGREDVALGEDVADLVELGERALAHALERHDGATLGARDPVARPREKDLAVAALADLGDDVEMLRLDAHAA